MEKKIEKKKKEIQESESQLPTLSEDVLWEHIMSKLPIKTSNAFRKHGFLQFLALNSLNPTLNHSPLLLIPHINSSYFLAIVKLLITLFSPGFRSTNTAVSKKLLAWALLIEVGSYNGLVCFFDPQFKFTICNPVTHQRNEIPDITIPNSFRLVAAGFYYLSSIDDYKIGSFLRSIDMDDQNFMVVYVFSLRTGQWETLANVHGFQIPRKDVPALVHDTIYWVVGRGSVVVGLNLVNGDLQLPSPYTGFFDVFGLSERVKVFGINGRLSIYFKGQNGVCQVWVLDEDGSSWTILHDLKSNCMRLLCVCQTTGNWLVLNNGRLALLDPSKSLTMQYRGGICFVGPIYNAWNFKMSLMSPVLE